MLLPAKVHAGQLVGWAADKLGGKGGGRPDMAQAGGLDIAGAEAADGEAGLPVVAALAGQHIHIAGDGMQAIAGIVGAADDFQCADILREHRIHGQEQAVVGRDAARHAAADVRVVRDRRGDEFRRASWDEALDTIATRFGAIAASPDGLCQFIW